MKKILLYILIGTFLSMRLSAQDTLQTLLKKIDTVNANINTINAQVDTLNKTINPLKDTISKIVNDQLIIDQSVLDSARKFPKEVLYQTYLFNKKNKDGMSWFYAIAAFIILVVMWVACINYAINDSLCKDPSFNRAGKRVKPQDSPFSYARTQLLWWTMIILSCHIFFFGVTGVLLPLNVTSVLLLGFGALVYGSGKIIDDRQIAASKGTRNQDLGAQNSEPPQFFKDILSDDNGISVHRFQAVVFNFAFGVGFIGFFIKSLINYTYPFADFTEWQFVLIGISSATYLGLKAAENNDPANKLKTNKNTDANRPAPNGKNVSPSPKMTDSQIPIHDETTIKNAPPSTPPPHIK